MTNYERAATALELKIPDMVPIFELMIDDKVIQGICPGGTYEDLAEEYDLDIVLTFTPSSNYRKEWINRQKGIFRDEWGVVRQFSDQTVPFPMDFPIKSEEDLKNYTPPDPLDPFRFKTLERLLKRFKNKKMVGMHVHDTFSYPTYLVGMDRLLMYIIEKPDFVKKLIDISVDHTRRLMEKAAELGADLFVFGDDYGSNAGPLMSPAHFREFFLPGMKALVDLAKNLGTYTIKHTDGNINAILPDIITAGFNGIHPLDPEAGMDIKKVKDEYGKKICIIGNIDTGKVLSESDPETVEQVVKETIELVAPGGGYMIASANSIHSHVKPENYRTMLLAARKYGDYRFL